MKYNLVVPLAGKGQRMIDGGYRFPKPMIWAGDRTILEHGMGSIGILDRNLIFVVRRDHVHNWAIDKFLASRYPGCRVIVAENETGGSVDSCYLAKDLIDNDMPLVVFTSDVSFSPPFCPWEGTFESDGFLLTFKANSDRYSYVQKDDQGLVIRTAEKVVISEDANAGVYGFKTGRTFCRLAEATLKTPGEHYLAPLYNLLIAAGGKVRTESVKRMHIMGTPEELRFFETVTFPYYRWVSGLILCSDHSGFEAKERTRRLAGLQEIPLHLIDVGCYAYDDCDYADYIERAIQARDHHPGYLILGFCRSGQGVNICANKHAGVRSVLVSTPEAAALGVRHNAANFFAIPAGDVHDDDLLGILKALASERFEGGRHQNRLQRLEP